MIVLEWLYMYKHNGESLAGSASNMPSLELERQAKHRTGRRITKTNTILCKINGWKKYVMFSVLLINVIVILITIILMSKVSLRLQSSVFTSRQQPQPQQEDDVITELWGEQKQKKNLENKKYVKRFFYFFYCPPNIFFYPLFSDFVLLPRTTILSLILHW